MRGSTGRLGLVLTIGATVAVLAACGEPIGDSGPQAITTMRSDSADCTGGAQATSDLQPALRRLGDSLTALGPAAERDDLPGELTQLDSARQSADRISWRLGTAADAMTADSPVQTEFRNASVSSAQLRDRLTEVRSRLTGSRARGDQPPQIQPAIMAFNGSVQWLSLACSNLFSPSTVDPVALPAPLPVKN
ncbi:hypothetical protein [Nocardia sp. NPDC052566]|uniref:hypothetical protein n=1 Tax=Nocardia sp. NPDC052566 TaxID=3364330 RepID=UPI0037C7A107